jgi:iron(III) transport system permease protein
VAFALVFIYVALSVFLPYSALIAGSVVRFFSSPNQLFATLTLENWTRVLNAPDIWNALQSTLLISTIGSVISVSLGFALAYGILKTEAKGRRILDYLAMAPIGVPGLVFSMGMIWAYIRTPIYATIWILMLTMVVGTIPNTLRILSSNLLQLSKEHEECSRICGASVLSTIKNIVIPLMKPAILTAFVITFIMLSRELSAAIFLSTASTRPLSVLTWDYLESGEWNMACVLGLIQAAIVLCMLSVFQMFFKTRVISEIR